MMGLSGMGDLVLPAPASNPATIRSASRWAGNTLARILGERNSIAEGVYTASAAAALAKLNVEMPITAAVDALLNRGAEIDTVIDTWLARPLRHERD